MNEHAGNLGILRSLESSEFVLVVGVVVLAWLLASVVRWLLRPVAERAPLRLRLPILRLIPLLRLGVGIAALATMFWKVGSIRIGTITASAAMPTPRRRSGIRRRIGSRRRSGARSATGRSTQRTTEASSQARTTTLTTSTNSLDSRLRKIPRLPACSFISSPHGLEFPSSVIATERFGALSNAGIAQ